MTPATLLGVWANPDDETYLSAGLMARARDRLVEHRSVRRPHGHAGSTSRSSAARDEVGPLTASDITTALYRRQCVVREDGQAAP